jgi:alkylated DNA repair dioxygenase AlkB
MHWSCTADRAWGGLSRCRRTRVRLRCLSVVVLQGSLLDSGTESGPRPFGPLIRRTKLADCAWVDLQRDWLAGADRLFERLLTAVPWRAERRPMYNRMVDVPRLLAFYGEQDRLPDELLAEARQALTGRYGTELGGNETTVGLCLYRDGKDSVAWHGDTIGRGAVSDTIVAIVSLGARRRFLLRPRSGGATLRFDLGGGDLLVMGGSCQRTWEHAVSKTARPVGPRISIQFRAPGVR